VSVSVLAAHMRVTKLMYQHRDVEIVISNVDTSSASISDDDELLNFYTAASSHWVFCSIFLICSSPKNLGSRSSEFLKPAFSGLGSGAPTCVQYVDLLGFSCHFLFICHSDLFVVFLHRVF